MELTRLDLGHSGSNRMAGEKPSWVNPNGRKSITDVVNRRSEEITDQMGTVQDDGWKKYGMWG